MKSSNCSSAFLTLGCFLYSGSGLNSYCFTFFIYFASSQVPIWIFLHFRQNDSTSTFVFLGITFLCYSGFGGGGFLISSFFKRCLFEGAHIGGDFEGDELGLEGMILIASKFGVSPKTNISQFSSIFSQREIWDSFEILGQSSFNGFGIIGFLTFDC